MDERLRELERLYKATGDQSALLRWYASLVRITGFVAQIESQVEQEIAQTVYVGWHPEEILSSVVIGLKPQPLPSPPKPPLDDYLSPTFESHWFDRAWDNYLHTSRGTLYVYVFSSIWESGEWDHELEEQFTLELTNVSGFGQVASYVQPHIEDRIAIINLLGEEGDVLEDHLDPYQDPPTLITGRCEDFPCCGHDICPPRWSTGEQAGKVCVCGRLLSLESRYSICADCMRRGDPDDPYDDFYDGGWTEDYDDEDDY